MSLYLSLFIIGITSGSIYALVSMGLVVTYTTSGVFNFGQGAIAMIAAFAFYSLRISAGVPTALAALIVVLILGPVMGVLIDRLLFRRLRGAPSAAYVVVSLGLLVALQGLAIVIYGPVTRPMPPIFSQSTFLLAGTHVAYFQLIDVLIAAGGALGLVAFFRYTQRGLQMRAVVDDPELTELCGNNAHRVTTLSWILGCSFTALAGVLISPILGVDATGLILLVIQAFGAAIVGRLVSLPLAYVGALGIGAVAALSTKFVASHPALAGIPTSLPFIVLFVVLLVSRKGSFREVTKTVQRAGTTMRRLQGARRFPVALLGAIVVVGVVLPTFLQTAKLTTATDMWAFMLMFVSLSLLLGLSRQVSLCQVVFVVFGATNLAHLRNAGVPYLPALLLSALIVVPIAALLSIPAIRLSGLFLALATFGFGVLAQDLLFGMNFMFGGTSTVVIDRPSIFGVSLVSPKSLYFFVLIVVVIGVIVAELVRVTRLGRLLRGLADSPNAIETLGINPIASRALVFCISGFLAALAGGLIGTLTQTVNTTSFDFTASLLWVAVLVAAGVETLGGSLLAAVLLIAVPSYFISSSVINYETLVFGVLAIVLAQVPNGLVGLPRLIVWPDFAALVASRRWRTEGGRRLQRLGDLPVAAPQLAGVNGSARLLASSHPVAHPEDRSQHKDVS